MIYIKAVSMMSFQQYSEIIIFNSFSKFWNGRKFQVKYHYHCHGIPYSLSNWRAVLYVWSPLHVLYQVPPLAFFLSVLHLNEGCPGSNSTVFFFFCHSLCVPVRSPAYLLSAYHKIKLQYRYRNVGHSFGDGKQGCDPTQL